jgi:gas vesicle protein
METGKVVLGVLGVLAGAAIGAVLGILFAPEKGAVTRRNISNKKDDYLEDMEDKYNEFARNIANKYKDLKSDVTGVVDMDKIKKDTKAVANGNI